MNKIFEDSERVSREKDWHNKVFAKDKYVRADCGKYYAANDDANTFYFTVIRSLLHKKKSIVLDYGCGDGHHLLQYSKYIEYGYGIDISDMRIARARSLIEKDTINNIEVEVMDATDTVFEDHKFDLIYGTAILHHLDLNKSLHELKRILKPDGNAIFMEPLGTNMLINLYRKLTPKARTIDEQPFRKADIDLILSYFPNSQFKYFSFLTLLAVPFRKSRFFKRLYMKLANWDSIVLDKNSPFKWWAWICIINLKK
ncbi:class I SAM-dependent methyltransferase [Sphingobacterium rhinopitheci]|uniref:class I SAM-dependent methyltransferase n=1 Tax=Sphingobacterium rhinopitheci TaxID=2781960 RepID=UPI001F5167F9|nr:class I SAM-dependent methyltransferase [Sphingobacterium rhinopitheci]MCI0921222.1 class I SAM-dependent methyltransferase [Sphingobacterium rhinopitheci]